MIRFIFVCMAVVALSAVVTGTQFLTDGIGDAREEVLARNTPTPAPAVEPAAGNTEDSVSFEEMYATAKAQGEGSEPFFSPDELNAIETTAGGSEFGADFTDAAPKALTDQPAMQPVAEPAAE